MKCDCKKLADGRYCDFHTEERSIKKDYRNRIRRDFLNEYLYHPDWYVAMLIVGGASPSSLRRYVRLKNASAIHERFRYFVKRNRIDRLMR